MDNLDQVFNPESNSFWNLLLAAGVVVISFFVARLVRRRVRTFLDRYELEDYAGALLARIAGWCIVLVGVVLALSIMGVDKTQNRLSNPLGRQQKNSPPIGGQRNSAHTGLFQHGVTRGLDRA